ncbi:hypothetical protein [Noviherbaspirillum agri]
MPVGKWFREISRKKDFFWEKYAMKKAGSQQIAHFISAFATKAEMRLAALCSFSISFSMQARDSFVAFPLQVSHALHACGYLEHRDEAKMPTADGISALK